jgi:hypothetical protein
LSSVVLSILRPGERLAVPPEERGWARVYKGEGRRRHGKNSSRSMHTTRPLRPLPLRQAERREWNSIAEWVLGGMTVMKFMTGGETVKSGYSVTLGQVSGQERL